MCAPLLPGGSSQQQVAFDQLSKPRLSPSHKIIESAITQRSHWNHTVQPEIRTNRHSLGLLHVRFKDQTGSCARAGVLMHGLLLVTHFRGATLS